ncbi:hypothetical protein PHMEG_00016465 [Phytophthora megakarya]|uniref:RNase H type-1 domain-containing protein n=1 Tax=Phytophthora megakarya TaxID=4795 RepID=A0A225VZ93_9STRA|nr:hypothetical protein PHMEG_00016465 [Phytophthora megakarya]
MTEYSGMINGVEAALDIGATDLVIVGDSKLAIQQSLGVIECKKESLVTQLNCHREIVARLKSVKYLHAVREYKASTDPLATEALESNVSSVVSTEAKLAELTFLNRIQEVIYAPITESSVDEPSGNIAHSQREIGDLTVTTSLQAKSRPKRVSFADENSVTDEEGAAQREEASGVTTEDSIDQEAELSRITVPNYDTSVSLKAKHVNPLTLQRERRRRIVTAHGEELRWDNLKTVLTRCDLRKILSHSFQPKPV